LLVAIRALAASLQTLGGGLTTAVTHYNAFRSKFVKTAFGKSNALETLGISVAGELKNPVEIQKMPDALETDSGIIDVEPIDEIEQ
jgi:DNA anti-recombination protein RmuC